MSLQEKAEAAPNWNWESSWSALSNKGNSDQDCSFSAILLMRNKVWSRSCLQTKDFVLVVQSVRTGLGVKVHTGFTCRNLKAAVRWSSMRFASSIKKWGQLQLLTLLLSTVLLYTGKRKDRENLAGQVLRAWSHCQSGSFTDRPVISFQPRLVLQRLIR